ncbi:hypothetical protein [Algoriphagus namhaensis]
MKLMYLTNVLVAGWIGVTSTFFPNRAIVSVFQNALPPTDMTRLVGCLWLAIAMLSLFGLWRPVTFSPVFLIQLIYKGTWLLVVALAALQQSKPYPTGMAGFFLVWVIILPFIIPWKIWIAGS